MGPTPSGRDRLLFELVAPDGSARPIYGPPAESALAAAAAREVEVTGKAVDRRGDGFAVELWVADGTSVRVPPS